MAAKADKAAGVELAEKNKLPLTEAYLREQEIHALSQQNKVYYGPDLKHVFRLKQEM